MKPNRKFDVSPPVYPVPDEPSPIYKLVSIIIKNVIVLLAVGLFTSISVYMYLGIEAWF